MKKHLNIHIAFITLSPFFRQFRLTGLLLLSFIVIASASCKKFVEIDPPVTQTITKTVFTDASTATAAINGIYSEMSKGSGFNASVTITQSAGLSADEFLSYSTDNNFFYLNSLDVRNSTVASSIWGSGYKYIYYANAALEGLAESANITADIKRQLEGEARFIRAFCYFYLVNLFGDVPLILGTDYRVNAIAHREPANEVYDQIIDDLNKSIGLLGETYIAAERIRVNKWAARALLARVYLYKGDWVNAETLASAIINNTALYSLPNSLNNVFLKGSTETIWQLQPVVPDRNTNEGITFILVRPPSNVSISTQLLNAFEVNDQRRTNWIGSYTGSQVYYYPNKYKIRTGTPVDEYSVVLRLAEQHLIRGEARVQQNNIAGAQADINILRNRAGLGDTPANDKATLLFAIEQERRIELFTEWGHRWLDLKRTNRADAVLSPVKVPNWQPTDKLYPIPQVERNNNPNLTQNDGY